MTGILFRKLLRDVYVPLIVLMVLLAAFQCLWAKIVGQVVGQLLPQLKWLGEGRGISQQVIEDTIFGGPGKIVKSMIGGENISLFHVSDMVTVGYVHAVVLTILCLWAVGRAASAIAGEIDRGTMELLLAQPLARARVLLAHFGVDLVTIPLLCASMWAGNWIGIWAADVRQEPSNPESPLVDAAMFGPALWNVGALIFAMSGYTMWLSARGRFRWRVLGLAVFITLLQYLVNVIGQLWNAVAPLRPFTVFYYYQPQQIILNNRWTVDLHSFQDSTHVVGSVNALIVLFAVGLVGYGLALWTFTRRDLPAPL
jgi:ABC-2 type transport system permease protein